MAVSIFVNSAELDLPTRLWKEHDPRQLRSHRGINLNGALYCIHAVLPAMRAQKADS